MKKMEIILKSWILFFGFMIFLALFCSIFNYFNLFSMKVSHVLCYIYIILMGFFLGFCNGKHATKRGFIEGIKVGGILMLFLLLFNVIFFQSPFTFPRLFYYLLFLFVTIVGAMLGINKQENSLH